MASLRILAPKRRSLVPSVVVIAIMFLVQSECRPQTAPAPQPPSPWAQELQKYPGLTEELGRLMEKLQRTVPFPPSRSESHLLPLLPESTISYVALPNYDDALQQALRVFREERESSAVLRDWWAHGAPATVGPMIESGIEKTDQLEQYLGPELVLSMASEGKTPKFVAIAEVRKPGLKDFLQQIARPSATGAKPAFRVFEPQELAVPSLKGPTQQLVVLVRHDFVVAAPDVQTLRSFNVRLEEGPKEFASSAFGKRVLREYGGGVTVLAAADLQSMLKQFYPQSARSTQPAFQQSGFADVQYLVWDHRRNSGRTLSEAELSFQGPRHGIAGWLAKPTALRTLDFVSPKAVMAGTVVLANPPEVYDDLKTLASESKSSPFAQLAVFEKALKLSVRDDLLGQLGGEFTVELDGVSASIADWRAIFTVKDSEHLQRTLNTLLAGMNTQPQPLEEAGTTYYTLRVPSAKATREYSYAFLGGYLIVASSHQAVAEAIRLHNSGESLGTSAKFLAALPVGHSPQASALLYQDASALLGMQMRQFAPTLPALLGQTPRQSLPSVIGVYAEDSAIREVSTNSGFDAAGVLIGAAIAIPNLMRSRVAANEASAVGSIRTVITAQLAYATEYPQKGFALNLASLGQDPHGPKVFSAEHAGLLDDTLANTRCVGDSWCTKSGYQFRVTTVCKALPCANYVVMATPASNSTGTRSFCSTSEGVIRFKSGPPLTAPISAAECRTWAPL